MKKISLILFATISILFISCNENDENDGRFDSNSQIGWVQFDEEAIDEPIQVVNGYASTIELPVVLFAPVNKEGVKVNYTITDVVGNSTAVLPQRSGTVEIFKNGAGEVVLSADLVLNLVEADLTSNVEFDVTLTGTDNSNVQVGLSDNSKPVVVRVKICAFNIKTNYVGNAVASVGVDGPEFAVELVPVPNTTNQFTVTSAWGIQMVPTLCNCPTRRDYPAIITVNDDFTVTIVGNDPTRPAAYPGGEGTYDPCTDTFNFTLRQGIFSSPFTVDVTYTPAP